MALTIWWLHAEAIAGAYRDSSNLAEVLAGQTASSIRSIDLILTEIKVKEGSRSVEMPDDFDRASRGEDMHQYLIERLSHLAQADLIALVDKNGKLINYNAAVADARGRSIRPRLFSAFKELR